jgi:hypothetical protein
MSVMFLSFLSFRSPIQISLPFLLINESCNNIISKLRLNHMHPSFFTISFFFLLLRVVIYKVVSLVDSYSKFTQASSCKLFSNLKCQAAFVAFFFCEYLSCGECYPNQEWILSSWVLFFFQFRWPELMHLNNSLQLELWFHNSVNLKSQSGDSF